ncbi:hypothetical protein BVG19_g424 [[Candida] boidinii]|nr:hypothetical protein BVG19_g424 [[Candida] boidinii]OWB50217.1 hypothetical protein B5S27_g1765 [[Candida] boidinii]
MDATYNLRSNLNVLNIGTTNSDTYRVGLSPTSSMLSDINTNNYDRRNYHTASMNNENTNTTSDIADLDQYDFNDLNSYKDDNNNRNKRSHHYGFENGTGDLDDDLADLNKSNGLGHSPSGAFLDFKEFFMTTSRFWNILFLVNSIVIGCFILALEIFLLTDYLKRINSSYFDNNRRPETESVETWMKQKKNAVATYCALYIYAALYQIFITAMVLYSKEFFNILTLIACLFAMAVYSGIQYHELKITLWYNLDHIEVGWQYTIFVISIVLIVVSCIFPLLQTFVAIKVKNYFNQSKIEKVGLNENLIFINQIFCIYRNVLLLIAFFVPAFTLQLIVIALDKKDPEFGITVAMLGLSYFVLILADYCAIREILFGLLFVIVIYCLGLAYLIFKIYRVFTRYLTLPGRNSLIVFGIITSVLLLILICLTITIIFNFNKGLKEIYKDNYHLSKKDKNEKEKLVTLEDGNISIDNRISYNAHNNNNNLFENRSNLSSVDNITDSVRASPLHRDDLAF